MEPYAARSRCFLPSLNAAATASAGNIEDVSDMSIFYLDESMRNNEMKEAKR